MATVASPKSRTTPAAARQTAAESLNAAIVRLAVRRPRPLGLEQREEMSALVNQALEAYRDYMRLGAAA